MAFLATLFKFIATKGIKGALGASLQQALKGYGFSANIDKTLMVLLKRPNQLARTLSKMPLEKLIQLEKVVNKAQHLKAKSNLIGNLREQAKNTINNSNLSSELKKTKLLDLKKLILKLNGTGNVAELTQLMETQKIDVEHLKDYEQDLNDFHLLSSSWLNAGEYNTKTRNLRLWISNRFYDFPNVSPTVWELMKEQRGKYGSGAGTIAWNNIKEFMDKRNWHKKKPRRKK